MNAACVDVDGNLDNVCAFQNRMDRTVTSAIWPEAGVFVSVLTKASFPMDSRVPLSGQKSQKAFANLVQLTFKNTKHYCSCPKPAHAQNFTVATPFRNQSWVIDHAQN